MLIILSNAEQVPTCLDALGFQGKLSTLCYVTVKSQRYK